MLGFLTGWIQPFIRYLSFDQSDYLLCQKINEKVPLPKIRNTQEPSHPLGFASQFHDTTISLVQLYASIIYGIKSDDVQERMRALKLLSEQYMTNADEPMPINLVRLRLFLMKRAIENTDSFYEQMKNLRDFQRTFHISKARLMKYLRRFNLSCAQETHQIGTQHCVFDPHVLDNTNGKERTFTNLLVDMFITGICDTTLVCSTLPAKEDCQEICEAANFLKIKLRIAASFDTYQDGYACRYLAIFPYMHSGERFLRFHSKHQNMLENLQAMLYERQNARLAAISRCIDNFNEHHLDNLNQNYSPDQPLYYLPKLTLQEICAYYGQNTLTHIHLGDFLYRRYQRVLFNRLTLMQCLQRNQRRQNAKTSQWDQSLFRKRYEMLEYEYENLSPYTLIHRYFADLLPERLIPSSHDLESIAESLHQVGGYIRFIPSDNLDENAYRFLFKRDEGLIDQVEVFNLCDSANKRLEDILSFAQFVQNYNQEAAESKGGIRPIEPVCASYSLNSEHAPFMGFLFSHKKPKTLKTCWVVPALIGAMIYSKGKPLDAKSSSSVPTLYHLDQSVKSRMKMKNGKNLSLWQRFIHTLAYIHPHIYQGLLLLCSLLAITKLVSLGLALILLILCGVYALVIGSLSSKQNMMENGNVNKEKMSIILFCLGMLVPILQQIFNSFNTDFFYAVPPVLVIFLQVFCLTAISLFSFLLYSKLANIQRESIKNPVLCLILSWPLTSVIIAYVPWVKIPAAVQLFLWTFILGLASSLHTFMHKEQIKRQKVMEEILENFGKSEGEDSCIPVLDLMYLLQKQPSLRKYWKSLCKQVSAKSQDAEQIAAYREKLRSLCMSVKEWCQDSQRYNQILEILLTHYTNDQADLMLTSTLQSWPTFVKFILKH